ncbi:hypothetical protein [Coleofasciculus sp. H7-2]|uniref:hypothetical protein n=1 Tax=Coleofasciculus sp. H7-2 TaxID=3351545 RepID=UPI00366B8424
MPSAIPVLSAVDTWKGGGNHDRDIHTEKARTFGGKSLFSPSGFYYPSLEAGVNKESQFAT